MMLSGPDKELVKFLISIINQKIYLKDKSLSFKILRKISKFIAADFSFLKSLF